MIRVLGDVRLKQGIARVITATVCLCAVGVPPISHAQTGQNTTTQYAYDAQGNLTQIKDPRGLVTTRSYDALNRLIQILQPPPIPGGSTPTSSIGYDGRNQIITVTDPRNLQTTYTVDGLGNTITQSSPDTGATARTYDAAGNVITSTDARGKQATYTYDALNRLTSISYPTGTSSVFQYDGGSSPLAFDLGHLTNFSDESGSTRLQYDAFGRVNSKTQTTASGSAAAQTQTVQYVYGSSGTTLGKLVYVIYPSGAVLGYTYDAAGRVGSIAVTRTLSGSGTVTSDLISNVAYNPFGQPIGWTWGNGTSYTRSFDLDGRLAQYSIGSVAANASTPGALIRTVDYDSASRITAYLHADASGSATSMIAVAANQSFTYDDLNRLTSYAPSGPSEEYAYDAGGNRTGLTIGSNAYTNGIDPTSNRLLATTGPAPAKSNLYDNAGNLISDGTVAYGYSDRGRLASAQVGLVTINYLYNALGQRTLKTGPTNAVPTGVVRFVYDEVGRLLGQYDAAANLVQETVYLGDLPVVVLKTN